MTDTENKKPLDAAAKEQLLQSYVARLSAGEDLESVRADFVKNFKDVDALEIANAEQHLIKSGVSYADVTKLCDVHSALFHGATKQEKLANAEKAVNESRKAQQTMGAGLTKRKEAEKKCAELIQVPGHPLNLMTAENDGIAAQVAKIRGLEEQGAPKEDLMEALQTLRAVGTHYAKKGDVFYTLLKQRYNITGPSDVMWSADDEIIDEMRAVAGGRAGDDWKARMDAIVQRVQEMIYKENNILFPICTQFFTDEEWKEIARDLKQYSLCLTENVPEWADASTADYREKHAREAETAGTAVAADGLKDSGISADEVVMAGGHLTAEQVEAVLDTIPMELTFVDMDDINRFYNDNGEPKLFKRPLSSLDRSVYLCHPPKIEPVVRRIIAQFRAGEKDEVGVWMKKGGEDVYVNYRAVRSKDGKYLGTLECVLRTQFAKDHYVK